MISRIGQFYARNFGALRSLGKPVRVKKTNVHSERILMVAYFDPRGLGTIIDNVKSWTTLSKFNFDVLNLFASMGEFGLELPKNLDLNHYDGLLIHSTVAYSPSNLRSLDQQLATKILEYRGLKILMKQDEHYRSSETAQYISDHEIDLVISLADPLLIERMYPLVQKSKPVEFYFALPGYISDELLGLRSKPLSERTVDVGYRGSIQPWQLGRLGYEKREVGERFIPVCRKYGLTYDISSKWEDRFFGSDWFRFLGSLRAVLGVESGSSIVDFDGSAEAKCAMYIKQHPNATYEQVTRDVLSEFAGGPEYTSISPRHFEAAATKTVQILYEGNYSGIFKPDRHYIPLQRDHRNIDEVIRKLRDTSYCERLTGNAFREIVENPKYHYRNFVDEVDGLILARLNRRS